MDGWSDALGGEGAVMAAVTLQAQGTRRTGNSRTSCEEKSDRAGAFSDVLEGRDEPQVVSSRAAGSGGAGGTLTGQGESSYDGPGSDIASPAGSDGDLLSGSMRCSDRASSEYDAMSDSMNGPQRETRRDRTCQKDETGRTGDQGDRGSKDKADRDKTDPPSGIGGGSMPPPSSPLAAMQGHRNSGGSSLSGLTGQGAGGLSVRAKIQSFLVGKSGDGTASVRMEISLENRGNIALTVQEGTRADAVRIVLLSRDMGDAQTATLASDLLKHLHNEGISVEAVESSDGTELASGGDSSQGSSRGGFDEDEEEKNQVEPVGNEVVDPADPGFVRSLGPLSHRVALSGRTGFFG